MKRLLPLVGLASVLGACSGSSSATTGPVSLVSDQGKIKIVLTTLPAGALNAGNDAVQLVLTDPETHAAIEDERIELVPFMPTMGHGTDVIPVPHAKGKGTYLFTNVNLYMPGEWQLRFKFMGPVSDSAAPDLQVQ